MPSAVVGVLAMAVAIAGCGFMPTPTPPAPVVTDVRLEQSPEVHVGLAENDQPPTSTAQWDPREGAWVDTITYLIIELQSVDDAAGYAVWQSGEFVTSGTGDPLDVSLDLASLPDPSGKILEVRYFADGVPWSSLNEGRDMPGLSPPV